MLLFCLTPYGRREKRKSGIRLRATNHLNGLGNLLDVLDRLEPQPDQLQVGHPSLLLALRSPVTVSIDIYQCCGTDWFIAIPVPNMEKFRFLFRFRLRFRIPIQIHNRIKTIQSNAFQKKIVQNLVILPLEAALFPRKLASHFLFFLLLYFCTVPLFVSFWTSRIRIHHYLYESGAFHHQAKK